VFPNKARKLLVEDQVAAVFGCWTSASRKAVLPIFEQLDGLLFYPVQYEGNESSRNIVYCGAVPNQQILPAIDWLLSSDGGARKQFYLVGSDYVFPRTAHYIIAKYLAARGGRVAGETLKPLGNQEFGDVVDAIQKAEPDVIFSTINGDSNVGFYRELATRGIRPDKLPVVATSVGEDELRSLLPEWATGHFGAWNYFQSVNTQANRDFVRRFRDEHGPDRVVADPRETAYCSVYLWKLAVETAGSAAVSDVRKAFASELALAGPGGRLRLDPKTHHVFKRFRMGRIREDRQFDIVHESPDWIAPDPYPSIAFPGWSCDWTSGGITRGETVTIPGRGV
jgi:urea transport system substrate-binding protein